MGIVADSITEMLSTPTIQQWPYVNWYKAVISRARLWTLLAYAQTCLFMLNSKVILNAAQMAVDLGRSRVP